MSLLFQVVKPSRCTLAPIFLLSIESTSIPHPCSWTSGLPLWLLSRHQVAERNRTFARYLLPHCTTRILHLHASHSWGQVWAQNQFNPPTNSNAHLMHVLVFSFRLCQLWSGTFFIYFNLRMCLACFRSFVGEFAIVYTACVDARRHDMLALVQLLISRNLSHFSSLKLLCWKTHKRRLATFSVFIKNFSGHRKPRKAAGLNISIPFQMTAHHQRKCVPL